MSQNTKQVLRIYLLSIFVLHNNILYFHFKCLSSFVPKTILLHHIQHHCNIHLNARNLFAVFSGVCFITTMKTLIMYRIIYALVL